MSSRVITRVLPVTVLGLVWLAACGQPVTEGESIDATSLSVVLAPETPVAVTGGRIQGVASETNPDIMTFKGIPYAAPPVGELRWRPPEPVVAWDGVRDADAYGASCVQRGRGGMNGDEDCLLLNVWAPRETTDALPVMVWIHGGGYTGGSGSSATYEGTPLASQGVVLVTINYRLNVFGFFAHPALSAESEHDASGNYGVMDMVAALEWVRDNIATFGGDPDRVTIFGESAGAGAVMSVMLVPQADGLFHRAIAESNWIYGWDRPLRESERGWEPAEAQGVRVAAALGVNDPGAALATMRAATADAVLEASGTGGSSAFTREGNVWAPNVDGWIIPDDPLAMYETGRQHDVPLIVGMNGNEGSMMTRGMEIDDVDAFETHVETVYPALADQALAHYDATSPDTAKAGIDHLIHDMYFAGPVRAHARTHANVSSPAWLYHFTHVPPTQGGATMGSHHAAELRYVFGTLTPDAGEFTDVDRQLSETMRAYWVQFATTGDPNRADLPEWPQFEAAGDKYLELGPIVASGTALHRDGGDLFDAFEAHLRAEN